MKFSFLITGDKYTKYDISKNTFGEDLNSPAPTTVPLHVIGHGLGSNSNLGEGEDFQPRQNCRKGGTSRELPFISPAGEWGCPACCGWAGRRTPVLLVTR